MPTDRATDPESTDEPPPDEFTEFLSLLNELKATGCNLLVTGDAPREAFTRASSQLLGDPDVLRYRVLAVTDATPESVAERLPDPNSTPRPLSETTRLLNHAGVPRSVTASATPSSPPELSEVQEIRIADPELQGLQTGLVETVADVAADADRLRPADLRVGLDSLTPLVEHYGADVVEECLDAVSERVEKHDAMAHYVFPDSYDDERVQALVPSVDAVIELRTVDPDEYSHDLQQRWHVPERDITTDWTPL